MGFWPPAGRRFCATAAILAGVVLAGAVLTGLAAVTAPAHADDRHAGYYYPEPTSRETYQARSFTLPETSRKSRIAFVTGITSEQNKAPYPPTAAIFAKGSEAEKLIIVALDDGRIDTVFRARAIFAQMTAVARLLPVFSELGVEDFFTFFDLAKMLGFEQITISNGRDFAHQVMIR
ncbi:molybdopterin-guanine dinucleotide biosynthesis protein A [Pelagibius sp.]|uniref:molybdopterin-guanine dinucleotide biosynthesis protein A n=1 Tax=Pelagibius sp. TaxID=1931238 RepID=UPI003B50C7DC